MDTEINNIMDNSHDNNIMGNRHGNKHQRQQTW